MLLLYTLWRHFRHFRHFLWLHTRTQTTLTSLPRNAWTTKVLMDNQKTEQISQSIRFLSCLSLEMAEKLMLWEKCFQKWSFSSRTPKCMNNKGFDGQSKKLNRFLKASGFWAVCLLKWLKSWCFEKNVFKNDPFQTGPRNAWTTKVLMDNQKTEQISQSIRFSSCLSIEMAEKLTLWEKCFQKWSFSSWTPKCIKNNDFDRQSENRTNFSKHQVFKLLSLELAEKLMLWEKCLQKWSFSSWTPKCTNNKGFDG